jgi:endonuclease G, mitochondrial
VRCAIASCLALGAFFQTQSAAFAATANCTTAEKTQADKQLWLNTRDKKAAIDEHLPWGVPTEPTSAGHERLVVQRDYVIDYDADLRIPIWVGYRLDSNRLGKSKRIDCFRSDPRLNADDASKLSDYDEPIFDQGHLANNADMTSSKIAVINSFVLSNMTPQYCQFNEGVFQMLENIVRLWAKASGTVYVITGSILDRNGDRRRDADSAALRMRSKNGNERVAIPTAFFKVIVRPREDGKLDTITLILPNDQTDLDGQQAIAHIGRQVSTISKVERMTGLKLLPGFSGRITQARTLWPFTGSAGHSLVQARCRSTAGHLH